MTILLEPLPSAGPHGRSSRLDPPRAHCTTAGILCGVTQPHAPEPSCSTASIFRIKANPTARFTGRRPIPRPPFSPWHINARFPALAKSEKATRSPSLSSSPPPGESHCLKPLSCTSRYPPSPRPTKTSPSKQSAHVQSLLFLVNEPWALSALRFFINFW